MLNPTPHCRTSLGILSQRNKVPPAFLIWPPTYTRYTRLLRQLPHGNMVPYAAKHQAQRLNWPERCRARVSLVTASSYLMYVIYSLLVRSNNAQPHFAHPVLYLACPCLPSRECSMDGYNGQAFSADGFPSSRFLSVCVHTSWDKICLPFCQVGNSRPASR